MRASVLLLTLAVASAPATSVLAQASAAPVVTPVQPAAAEPPIDTLVVPPLAVPPVAASKPALTPLEAEACRRLQAEEAIAIEAALAPPAPKAEVKKPMTRAEGAGTVAGSIAGQVAGAAVAGPVGAAVGAIVVGQVGKTVVNTAGKVFGSDKKEKEEEAAKLAAAEPLTVPGPPPELLAQCAERSEVATADSAATPAIAEPALQQPAEGAP